jgi:hypothetical protein
MAIMFKVGTGNTEVDYSNRVIAGSYDVQTKPVYTTWYDGDGKEHRKLTRNTPRTEGSFDMWFKTIEEYNDFAAQVASERLSDLTNLISVRSNTTNQLVSSKFFVDFSPIRTRKGDWTDIMERFTVSIKEM